LPFANQFINFYRESKDSYESNEGIPRETTDYWAMTEEEVICNLIAIVITIHLYIIQNIYIFNPFLNEVKKLLNKTTLICIDGLK